MSLLPQNTSLGALVIVEIFAEHDFPCVFACKNDSEQLFVATWVSESNVALGWLYVGVSPARLRSLREQFIPLRDAFTLPESGKVYRVEVPRRSNVEAKITSLLPSELTDEILPMPNVLVEESIIIDAAALAFHESTEDAEIVLDGDPVVGHAIDARFLGMFLKSVQDYASQIMAAWWDGLASLKTVGVRTTGQTGKILVLPTFTPSSFKLSLKLAGENADNDISRDHLEALDLISQSLIGDSTVTADSPLMKNSQVRTKYRSLLKLLYTQGATVTVRTKGNPYGVRMTSQQARSRVEKLSRPGKRDIELVGLIPGGSLERKRFEIRVGEHLYTGRVSSSAEKELRGIGFGSKVSAVLRESTRSTESGTKTWYVLQTVKLAEEDAG